MAEGLSCVRSGADNQAVINSLHPDDFQPMHLHLHHANIRQPESHVYQS